MSLRYSKLTSRYSNTTLGYLLMKTSVKTPKTSQVNDLIGGNFSEFSLTEVCYYLGYNTRINPITLLTECISWHDSNAVPPL
jgi:hypothetical protein